MADHDVVVVGAGSVGIPISMALADMGFDTLVVEKRASPGQGENKHAIGGIRATHSDPAKILSARRSLEIFSTWEEKNGDDIEWLRGGYTFPVYSEKEEKALKSILPIQKEYGLKIDFVGPDRIGEVVPGINPDGLLGGTYSPDDGSASPLMAANAFFRYAREKGVEFRFRETVQDLIEEEGAILGVRTDQGEHRAPVVIDAAGPYSPQLCSTAGVEMPVYPESHEGAITEPVERFFSAMVVDLRPGPGSANYYFYQNTHGQVVFCITPEPAITGLDRRETSVFLPQVARRMIGILPRLKNIRVRRVWRGLYPMTPDGSPLVGWNRKINGLMHATGMCGQGYMLGPGIGETVARSVAGKENSDDSTILTGFDPYRDFAGEETLK